MTNKKNIFILVLVAAVALLFGNLLSGLHFGDATVSIFPTWYSNGINIGSVGPKSNELDQVVFGSFSLGQLSLNAGSSTVALQSVTSSAMLKLAVGDLCFAQDTATTTTPFFIGYQISSIATSTSNVSTTLSLSNQSTSTLTLATGTIEYACFDNAAF